MELIARIFLLIILSSDLTFSKQFEMCEFVEELYRLHEIPREDIYKHLCIAQSLHTARNARGFLGVYGIGEQWWCKEDEPGGSCNVKCSNLLDDDIADDVQCAGLILLSHGFEGWQVSEDSCRNGYATKANDCLAPINALLELQNRTTQQPINEVATPTRHPLTSSRASIPSTKNVDKILHQEQQTFQPAHEYSCRTQNIFIVTVLIILFVLLLVIVVKYKRLKRYLASKNRDQCELENPLVL